MENYTHTKPSNLENVGSDDAYKKYCRRYIRDFFGKVSQREIARRLKVGKTTINRWAKDLGFYFKKHTVNDDYFKNLSPEMAYILGYVSADGNVAWDVSKGYYSLTITAAEKDKSHLGIIRKLLKSTKPLLYSSYTKSYRLIVNNKQICRDLMRFGIVPRKSLIIKFPDLPDQYLKDFIRGYIDGDGSLRYFKRPRSPYFELSVCSGSRDFIVTLEEKIFQQLNINSRITKTKNNCFLLRYSCQRGLKLAKWIYGDASLYLPRKFIIYQEALSFRKELAQ
jgi:hypothetical protein